jgi:hypothetical protein
MKRALWTLSAVMLAGLLSVPNAFAGLGNGFNGDECIGCDSSDGSTGGGRGTGTGGKNTIADETIGAVPDTHTEGGGDVPSVSESNPIVQSEASPAADLQPMPLEDSKDAAMPETMGDGNGIVAAQDALAEKLPHSTQITVDHGAVDVKSLEPSETNQS